MKITASSLIKLIGLLLTISCMAGCATLQAGSVKRKYSKIDYSHGISREDAIVIAQNYVLRNKYCVVSLTPTSVEWSQPQFSSDPKASYYTAHPKYQDKTVSVWIIGFSSWVSGIPPLPLPYFIYVACEDGFVIHEYGDTI